MTSPSLESAAPRAAAPRGYTRVRANVARVRPQASARPDCLLTRIEGDEHLLAAIAEGGGLVLVTAHLGNVLRR